ncbi:MULTISPECIES: YdcF family protein [unclassified Granulicatella]|uniref:YdcF family protein n=1 Tax=unclassified Granulicatella TaxID=2630493 RepID=UPI001073BD32|nr:MULTISPECIES: YdcF family protein [unclassified Granulicatella]MBF0780713.1 YdcF family protein [Granulicatella sp. 19428wC4_WM01]TFU94206.1 YdcF family protein [Granulicatella sp. WM01]
MEILGMQLSEYIYGIFLCVSMLCLGLYLLDRTRVLNGLLFLVWVLSLMFTILFTIFQLNNHFLNEVAYWTAIVVAISVIGIIMISPFLLTFGLFINAWIVYKKEQSIRLANMLTFFLGIVFSIIYIIGWGLRQYTIPIELDILLNYITIIQTYVSLYFINFIISALLYRFYFPNYKKDYLIVLGSGLIDGHIVPPLLASRIDRAIAFYNKARKRGHTPIIIFSGGQGDDELLSEGEAMKKYALHKGVTEEHILVEGNSKNTYENMLFSKQLIQQEYAKVLFFTNNFHVFRAAIFARRAKLNAKGIGSKTALYFLPNAILREFIALVHLHKKKHIIILSLITCLYLLGAFISYRYIWFS